ncbi:MAG TPA: hypothetical protein VMY41_15370 [Thermohalobaculum sp.]|nr:hypothetical protein [Thermohalobaculum sp.]
MLRCALLAGAALLLGGCLSTKEPVFDETNSLPLGEIPEFIAFVDAWENFVNADDSPREMIAEGGRGIVVDGILVVHDKAEYFAVAMVAGRPLACVIHADHTIEAVAAAHGVTVELDKSELGDPFPLGPVPVAADGPPEALMTFIRDQFANQALACTMPKRGG